MTDEERQRLEELGRGTSRKVLAADIRLAGARLVIVDEKRRLVAITAKGQRALTEPEEETAPPPAPDPEPEPDPPPPPARNQPLEGEAASGTAHGFDEAVDDRPFEHYPEDNPS